MNRVAPTFDNSLVAATFDDLQALSRGDSLGLAANPLPPESPPSIIRNAIRSVSLAAKAAFEGRAEDALRTLAPIEAMDLPVPPITNAIAAVYDLADRSQPDKITRTIHDSLKIKSYLSQILYEQANLKTKLLSLFSVEDAAAVYATFFDDQQSPKLSSLPLESIWSFLVARGGAHVIVPPGHFIVTDPAIFGSGARPAITARGRSIFCGAIVDAVVRHRSSFIEASGKMLLDFQEDELNAIDVIYNFDPAIMTGGAQNVLAIQRQLVETIHLPEAIHLGGATSRAFGHWIWEYIFKICGAIRSESIPPAPVLIDAGMPTSHREALTLLGGDAMEIIEIPTFAQARVAKLWVLSDWAYVPICPQPKQFLGPEKISAPPEELAKLVRWMCARTRAPTYPPRKLFLARKSHLHRKMLNQQQIAVVAEELGFWIIYMDEHPFAEQIGLVRSAEALAGPEGSSFMLGLFAKPGAKITILNHPFVENLGTLTTVFDRLEIDSLLLQGRCVHENADYPRFSDYEIDESEFRSAVCR